MKARGKREAKRSASPLVRINKDYPALKGRNTSQCISAFQASILFGCGNQGRRASRLPLAFISRAVGAKQRARRRLLSYLAVGALLI